MRTEEANHLKDKMETLSLNSSKANLVESSGTVVKGRATKCYQRKGQDSKQEGQSDVQAHLVEGNEVIVAVIVEANLVANKIDWMLDIGASRHFRANKELFHDFDKSTDGDCVYMGNSTIVGVMAKGMSLNYVNPIMRNGEHVIELKKEEIEKATEKWKQALILYVVGESPTIAAIERYIALQVNTVSKPKVYYHNDGYFLVKFASVDDRNEVLYSRPHMLNNKPI
ncbi:hypothetical protein H5410_056174 [Solanum commersonii]|uniref:DUF4283 domain-containing protein n=1 Tax=Solanum commersonii TaxID=4109 RepID=A0A9J5WLY5_SOLCO|nr:hypothetical protein H5410_056174 [Solanum commersonii]